MCHLGMSRCLPCLSNRLKIPEVAFDLVIASGLQGPVTVGNNCKADISILVEKLQHIQAIKDIATQERSEDLALYFGPCRAL